MAAGETPRNQYPCQYFLSGCDYEFQAGQTHTPFMKRAISDYILASLSFQLRVWLEQRAKRRQSLRIYRLTTRAARKLR